MKYGHECIECHSLTTSSEWYRYKDGYICAKCKMFIKRRETGEFQNIKEKISQRTCNRCKSNKTKVFINKKGYKYHDWHRVKDEKDKWLCYSCFSKIKDTTLICEKCNEKFVTNYINKYYYRTQKLCKNCRDCKKIKPNNKSISNNLEIKCCKCGSNKTRKALYKNGTPYYKWYNYGNGFKVCAKCYDEDYKIRLNNIKNGTHTKRIKYKSKFIYIKELKRTGRCSWCTNNIFDGSCKQTQLHHNENNYDDENPLDNGIELCASCHRKETIRLAKTLI